jgi:phosphatidylserine/phosphatidylglycerophosphate/cardiolipin synthase-like enzyme
MTPLRELKEALSGDAEQLRKLGQALWACTQRPCTMATLLWARGVLGARGEEVLFNALNQCGAGLDTSGQARSLRALPVCRLLAQLEGPAEGHEGLVWTLPDGVVPAREARSYLDAARALIDDASERALLVSPYLERKGVGMLAAGVVRAVQRGVHVRVLTHGVASPQGHQAQALEELRSDVQGLAGALTVYSCADENVLLHPKIVVVDGRAALIGSANLTSPGLTRNFEAGVHLSALDAAEAEAMVEAVLSSAVVRLAFSTRAG